MTEPKTVKDNWWRNSVRVASLLIATYSLAFMLREMGVVYLKVDRTEYLFGSTSSDGCEIMARCEGEQVEMLKPWLFPYYEECYTRRYPLSVLKLTFFLHCPAEVRIRNLALMNGEYEVVRLDSPKGGISALVGEGKYACTIYYLLPTMPVTNPEYGISVNFEFSIRGEREREFRIQLREDSSEVKFYWWTR